MQGKAVGRRQTPDVARVLRDEGLKERDMQERFRSGAHRRSKKGRRGSWRELKVG